MTREDIMLLDEKPYTFDRVARIAVGVALIWGLVWLLGYLSDVLIPFAVALLLAYIMNPLVTVIERKVKNRLIAVLISLVAVFTLVAVILSFLIPLLVTEFRHMGQILGTIVATAREAHAADYGIPSNIWKAVKEYIARPGIQDLFMADNFWTILEEITRKMLPGVWGVITGTASFVMWLVGLSVIALYLVFLLLDYEHIMTGWTSLIPQKYRETVMSFIDDFESIMNRYFRGQTLVATLVGILFALGFWIIGLPLGLLFGLFVGLLNLVPYLQLVALIPAALLAVFQTLDTGTALWITLSQVAVVFLVVQTIQDTVIVPKVMGRVTGFNPAMILLAMSVWGKLLGIFGLIIALPMTFLLLTYYRRFFASSSTHTPDT